MAKRTFVIRDDEAPDRQAMMLATVVALKGIGGSGTNNEIAERIIENEGISDKEQSYPQPNDYRSKLNYNLAWVRTALRINGDLENSARGVWALTDAGYQINTLEDANKSFELNAIRKRTNRNKKDQRLDTTGKDTDSSTTDNISDETNNPDNEDWKTTLLNTLKSMEGYAFERLCQLLLRESGFIEVNVNPKKGADGGIDGIGVLRVNLVSFKVYFQCKCWTDTSVSSPEIQKFRGALDASVDKALFITTSSFTSSAKEEATVKGKTVIDLIDGDRLCDLLKKNNLGVQTEMVEQVNITPEWFDRFNTK